MKYKTIREAAEAWVHELSQVPVGVVEKLMANDENDVTEITPPVADDYVHVIVGEYRGFAGHIVAVDGDEDDAVYTVDLVDGPEGIKVTEEEIEVQNYGELPMWRVMWAFKDSLDNEWLYRSYKNGSLRAMAECGFRIYMQEDYQYIFGIDGAGYDFYEDHWIPLYKARGLHWHEEANEDA